MKEVSTIIRSAAIDSGFIAVGFAMFGIMLILGGNPFFGIVDIILSVLNIGNAIHRWNVYKVLSSVKEENPYGKNRFD